MRLRVLAAPQAPSSVDFPTLPTRRSFLFSGDVALPDQIALGRGPEFQIGHGVLMFDIKPQSLPLAEALGTLCIGWAKVRAHIEEVFFGDTRGIAAALNALDGPAFNPFKLTETTFADDLRFRLEGPANFNEANVYGALRAFASPRG